MGVILTSMAMFQARAIFQRRLGLLYLQYVQPALEDIQVSGKERTTNLSAEFLAARSFASPRYVLNH